MRLRISAGRVRRRGDVFLGGGVVVDVWRIRQWHGTMNRVGLIEIAHLLLLARASRGDALTLALACHGIVLGCSIQGVVWY